MVIIIPYFNFTNSDTLRKNHILCVKRMAKYGYPVITAIARMGEILPSDITFKSIANHYCYCWFTGTFIWHKEQLINMAFERCKQDFPEQSDKLLWIDSGCYLKKGTIDATVEALDTHDTVQCYYNVLSLSYNGKDIDRSGWGSGSNISMLRNCECGVRKFYGSHGGAWAATSEFFTAIDGLYTGMIMGGGDTIYLSGVIGEGIVTDTVEPTTDILGHTAVYKARVAALKPKFKAIPGTLYHMWHTTIAKRNLASRRAILKEGPFNPELDLVREPYALNAWSSHASPIFMLNVSKYIKSRISAEVLRK